MSKFLSFITGILIVVSLAAGVWLVRSRTAGMPFVADGNLTFNNPGQKPDIWYLVYEQPGAPALSVQLYFDTLAERSLTIGEHVHVEGVIKNGVVRVAAITPIQITETGMHVSLYFYKAALDQGPGGAQCSMKGIIGVDRIIATTTMPLTAAIQLLLRGELSDEEKAEGVTTEFPLPGVTLLHTQVINGVAQLTFNDPQYKTSGGSCRVAIMRNEITATAKQFPTVTSVELLPEDLFQP